MRAQGWERDSENGEALPPSSSRHVTKDRSSGAAGIICLFSEDLFARVRLNSIHSIKKTKVRRFGDQKCLGPI